METAVQAHKSCVGAADASHRAGSWHRSQGDLTEAIAVFVRVAAGEAIHGQEHRTAWNPVSEHGRTDTCAAGCAPAAAYSTVVGNSSTVCFKM